MLFHLASIMIPFQFMQITFIHSFLVQFETNILNPTKAVENVTILLLDFALKKMICWGSKSNFLSLSRKRTKTQIKRKLSRVC
jgi:hypothetical protein